MILMWLLGLFVGNFEQIVVLLAIKRDFKMNTIPEDPIILFSYINTKLRDYYPSLDALCDDMQLDKKVLLEKLAGVGFEYNPEQNKFW